MNKMIRTLTIGAVSALTTMFAVADGGATDGFAFKNGDTIAFLGDSITQAGSYDDGYIRLFEKVILNLGIEQYTFFERGVGGNTSADMLARVDNDVVAYHPTWTTYSAGVNDICYTGKTQTLDQYKANVTATFDKLDACGTKVIVFTTTPISEQTGESALDPYVTWLREEANRRGYRIAEMNTAMKAELIARGATGQDPWKLTTDGIHLNADGNKIMAWELLKAFGIAEGRKDEMYGIFASGDPVTPPSAKAVWREGTKTLTFYYNTHSYTNDADVTKEYAIGADGAKTWDAVLSEVEHAAFDLSFVYFMPTSCTAWFWKADKMKDIDRLDYLNTVNCTTMAQMFGDCGALTNLNLSFFNTAKVTNMSQMLRNLSLTELDLSSFDTSNVTTFWQMFVGDQKLETIYVSDTFVTNKVTNSSDMFTSCTSLVGGKGTAYDSSQKDGKMAHIDAVGNPGYLSRKGDKPDKPDEPGQDDPGPVEGAWQLTSGNVLKKGEWEFSVSRRTTQTSGVEGACDLWVGECIKAPSAPSVLDFTGGIDNLTGNGKRYEITDLNNVFYKKPEGSMVQSLVLPETLQNIVGSAFLNCVNLESVTPFLPASCKKVGGSAFQGCAKLATPLVFSGTALGTSPGSDSWNIFYGCESIPSADLSGSTVTALYRGCFDECKALKEIRLPPTLEKFGISDTGEQMNDRSAVSGCSGLKIYVNGTTLPRFHTDDAAITKIVLGENLTTLPEVAFSGLTKLRGVYFCGDRPEEITQQTGPKLFTGLDDHAVHCFVPAKYADNWSSVAVGGALGSEPADWISGSTQYIRLWNYGQEGFYMLIGGGAAGSIGVNDDDDLGEPGFLCTLVCKRENGQYALGENAEFLLTCTQDGQADAGRKVRVEWYNGKERVSSETITLSAKVTTISKPVTKACSYKLTVMPLEADGKDALTWTPSSGVIGDRDNIGLPADYMPSDFDSWWDSEVAAQSAIPMSGAVRRERVVDQTGWEQWRKDKWAQCYNYDVRIPAAGTNWVAGGLTIPKDNTRKYPVYLKFYGVGWDGVCECDQSTDRITFCVNCHGLPSADATWETDYPAMRTWIENYAKSGPEAWQGNYQMIGTSQGRDNVYYRYVFLRAARAVEYAKTLPEWDGKTIIVGGCSQGAAQSVAAAALSTGVTHVVLGVPALTDFSGDKSDPKRAYGWPYVTRPPTYGECEYFDVVNLAHRIKNAKVFVVCGLVDYLVQPCGPVSLYNAFDGTNDKSFESHSAWSHDSVSAWGPMGEFITAACK